MEKTLSIIIPTYNMEALLPQCLDSLLIPSLDSLEVLVINDGSRDGSLKVAQEYASRFPGSIKVIDKPNGNYGSCINRALAEATGKYVKILDADDSYDTAGLEALVSLLGNCDADVILTNYTIVDTDGNTLAYKRYKNLRHNTLLSMPKVYPDIIYRLAMHGITYRRSILTDNRYRQTEGISYTDQEWIYLPIACASTILYHPVTVYRYLMGREGQTMETGAMLAKASNLLMVLDRHIADYKSFKRTAPWHEEFMSRRLKFKLADIYSLILKSDNRQAKEELAQFDRRNLATLNGLQFPRRLDPQVKSIPATVIIKWRNAGYDPSFTAPKTPLRNLGHNIMRAIDTAKRRLTK